MNAEVIPLTERLLSALLTGLYQGLLITGIVWLSLKLGRHANAATRYAIWCVTLAVVAALPLLHFALGSRMPQSRTANPELSSTGIETALNEAAPPTSFTWPSPVTFEPSIETTRQDSEAPLSFDPSSEKEGEGDPLAQTGVGVRKSPGSGFIAAVENIWANRLGAVWLPAFGTTGVIVICAISALAAGRLLALALQLFALRTLRTASSEPPAWLQEQFRSVASQAGLRRAAELRVSDKAHTPIVVGLHPPAVLIPEEMLATPNPARLKPVLRHEIAHLQRFDDWINLFQQGLKALFGFHPAVLWISRRIAIEREIACDDHVLHAGQKPRDYALFLTEFATKNRSRVWSAAPAAWSRQSQLTERVNMILKTNRSISPRVGRTRLGIVSATLAGCAVLMLAAAPRVSLGDQPPAPPTPPSVADLLIEPVVPAGVDPLVGREIEIAPAIAEVAAAPVPVAVALPGAMERQVAQSGRRPKYEWEAGPRPETPNRAGGSIEERMERLERMVERLVNEQRPGAGYGPPRQPGMGPQPQPVPPAPMAPAAPRAMPERALRTPGAAINPYHAPEHQYSERLQSIIKRNPDGAPSEIRLRMLETRRKALEQQIAAIEGQLHQLERQQDELEREREKMEEEREMQFRESNRARQELQNEIKKRDQGKQDEKKAREKEQEESSNNSEDEQKVKDGPKN